MPDYLPAIPADPYDGQPFRYSKVEKKIWAIGSDLTDQGGRMKFPSGMMEDHAGSDLVLPLDVHEMNPTLAPPAKQKEP